MKYYQAPRTYQPEKTLFLAGGITNCPDWQTEVASQLRETFLSLFNPRRKEFPINDPLASRNQIEWEYKHLNLADGILFWFPCETLCPIVLFELGSWLGSSKPLFIGVHPDYKRKADVEIQTKLKRKNEEISYSLEDLVVRVKEWSDFT